MRPTAFGRDVELFLVDEKSDRIEAANAINVGQQNKEHTNHRISNKQQYSGRLSDC